MSKLHHSRASKSRSFRWLLRIIFPMVLAGFLSGCAGALQPVPSPDEFTPPPSSATQWSKLQEVRRDNWFHLLNTGSEALDWRLRAIDSAADSIDLQTFIWDLDGSGELVRDHLLAAAARGVFVRVLVDDSFIMDADEELLDIDQHAHIELKVFNPYKRRSNSAGLRQLLNMGEFHRLDHRMHNKVMVVDNRVAVMGGRNIADHYFGFDESDNFRDMELVAGGAIVQELADGFDSYWNNTWSFPVRAIMEQRSGFVPTISPATTSVADDYSHEELNPEELFEDWESLARSAHSGTPRLFLDEPPPEDPADPDEAPVQVAQELIREIDDSNEEIWLVSAYLIPTQELEAAIQRATARGVKVRILTNSINSNNHLTAHSAYRKHIEQLLIDGAEVHELRADAADRDLYIESPVGDKSLCLHAKLIVLDHDRVFIGSANLDPRSLNINTEMGLLIASESLNSALREFVEPDFELENAWQLSLGRDGKVRWQSDTEVLDHQPTHSFMRRIEDWFLTLLPIEDEM